MGRHAVLVVGAAAGAVVSGLAFLIQYRFGDHDSWGRALLWAGGWVLFMTIVIVGSQLWHDRGEGRMERIKDVPRSQS